MKSTQIRILESCRAASSILKLAREWGYQEAPDPGYRQGKLWWAGFSKGGQNIYAWEPTAKGAIKQAAIRTVKELGDESAQLS